MSDAPAPPTIGPPSISAFADGSLIRTIIAYPEPLAGSRPVLGVALYVSMGNPDRADLVPMINLSAEAGQFERTCKAGIGEVYAVLAFDDATPPTVSEPAFEPLVGGDPSAEWAERARAFVRAFLIAELTPERIDAVRDRMIAHCRAAAD